MFSPKYKIMAASKRRTRNYNKCQNALGAGKCYIYIYM